MTNRILPSIAVLGLASLFAFRPAAAEQITPTPRATPLPITATNRPFLGARTALQPVDLTALGYVEEEYLLSGTALSYEWAAPGAKPAVRARAPRVPYATRILVRRPLNARRASGRVIVELLNPNGPIDQAPLWGLSWEYFLRQGDVWVGLTIKPAAAEVLRRFDPVRYAALSFAYRQAPECAGESPQSEDALAWDIMAQLGALLRSSSKENPLANFDVRRLIAAEYTQGGGYLVTYINAVHGELRLGSGRPVYDGYLEAAAAPLPAPLNQCAAPLPAGDARSLIGRRDSPLVKVLTQTDLARAGDVRRADSNDPEDYFRRYEVAGAARSGPYPAGQPSLQDLQIAGIESSDPAETCVEPQSSFPLGYVFNAVWAQYEDYLLRDLPMQSAPPLELDGRGNTLGGVRLPQITVPLAAYAGRSTPRDASPRSELLCRLTGSMRPFDSVELKALYGNRAGYLKRFNQAVGEAVDERWLVPADAAASKKQAARTAPAF